MGNYAFLIDTRFCTGCNTCFYKCVQENRYHFQAAKGLARTTVFIQDNGLLHHRCMHCENPSCVASCPSGAFYKTPEGIVLHNPQHCIGCRTCVVACPFNVPQWDSDKKEFVKCTMCIHRVSKGLLPACVEACPTEALTFGKRQEILDKSQKLSQETRLFMYGREENGGTSVFILTKEKPTDIGYPSVANISITGRGSKTLVGATAAAAIVYIGLKKYSERRKEIEEKKKQ
ncbi:MULTISPECIES: 4Fe-4S dicluster domain-containing protein [Thermodesulfovibrio]|uniref:4Fe-4S dicluster domain-containing protein n=1 Tax=Thermodesulfovibrio TaxID=28261 RepID=UPI0003FC3640|nr:MULTISPECIES: 4Fe-4S dicluster domain-containing protein [Thermodesulfovibrio]MDI6865216.1 4Fe-4S dicluster domain-containing protein [Thermodesulfovibrio yellowstonii]